MKKLENLRSFGRFTEKKCEKKEKKRRL